MNVSSAQRQEGVEGPLDDPAGQAVAVLAGEWSAYPYMTPVAVPASLCPR